MKGLWPKWNMTWMLQEEWTSLLTDYSQEIAEEALRKVFREGHSSVQPFPNEFMRYVRSITETTAVTVAEYPERQATLWLICVERGRWLASPGYAVYCPAGTTKAQALVQAKETGRGPSGGVWEVFEGRQHEARKRSAEIKAGGKENIEQAVSEPEEPFDHNAGMQEDDVPF